MGQLLVARQEEMVGPGNRLCETLIYSVKIEVGARGNDHLLCQDRKRPSTSTVPVS